MVNDAFSSDDLPSQVPRTLYLKLKALAEAIDELNSEIDHRKRLNQDLACRIHEDDLRIALQLDQMPQPWSAGYLPELEQVRLGLQGDHLALKKERRREDLNRWKDLVALIGKRREFVLEYEILLAMNRTSGMNRYNQPKKEDLYEELFQKLAPFYPGLQQLWQDYVVADSKTQRLIEGSLRLALAQEFGAGFDEKQILLDPPAARIAEGAYSLGTVHYGSRKLHPFGLKEEEWGTSGFSG